MAIGKKIIWTKTEDDFLKENYLKLTNPELAENLGLKLTVTRNRLRHLGLRRIEMEYFTTEQLLYVSENFRTMGNQRIANNLNALYPKKKKWTKNHIIKKLKYLGLKRTVKELERINSLESSEGGLRFTILKNSSSLNMHPSWIAQRIAWRDKAMQLEVLKHPELLEVKKNQLLLSRKIKNYGKK